VIVGLMFMLTLPRNHRAESAPVERWWRATCRRGRGDPTSIESRCYLPLDALSPVRHRSHMMLSVRHKGAAR
jgi:hypothetical protein